MTVDAPLILDVKGNSLDDGPGIRTVIFFKGCPLQCVWCHNPESKRSVPEIAFDKKECVECGTCRSLCPAKAINVKNPDYIDRSKCTLCFKCADSCPSGALVRVGKSLSVAEIVGIVEKDLPFFKNSGGGVTLSGGEPTMYLDFVSELLQVLGQRGIPAILETCGHFALARFDSLIYPHLNAIYFDLKLIDSGAHKKYCGVPNERILENFAALFKRNLEGGVPVLPRIPLIPTITATKANLEGIAAFLRDNSTKRVAIMDYNPLWHAKAAKIGQRPAFGRDSWMSKAEIQECRAVFSDFEVI